MEILLLLKTLMALWLGTTSSYSLDNPSTSSVDLTVHVNISNAQCKIDILDQCNNTLVNDFPVENKDGRYFIHINYAGDLKGALVCSNHDEVSWKIIKLPLHITNEWYYDKCEKVKDEYIKEN